MIIDYRLTTSRLVFVTWLNDRRFSYGHSFRSGNGFAGRHFIGKNLFNIAALLFRHLIVTGIEIFLLQIPNNIEKYR